MHDTFQLIGFCWLFALTAPLLLVFVKPANRDNREG